ncbi:MAG: MotA/TolQ/ExbB proton channel family protein [Candidatus Omnitrophica bacterium]|nr:MotA/TolQ/ExbB proton channel family protein [Candidatus Omnitrophota bacterium]
MLLWDQSLPELFGKGHFVMWPLLLCSIVGATIIVERLIYFLRLRFDYGQFKSRLESILLKEKDVKKAILLCRKSSHPVPRVAREYLTNLHQDRLREEIVRREGSLALEKLESHLRTLAAITHLAPLLGLLGTVTGLVTAFHQIEQAGGYVQASGLAGGIWEALITTVFGLCIAIPCMAAYHGFESHVDQVARHMQFMVSDLNEFFGKKSAEEFRTESMEKRDESLHAVTS